MCFCYVYKLMYKIKYKCVLHFASLDHYNRSHGIRSIPVLTLSRQDIKDHLRSAGDVYYAEVYGDGTGIVEFASKRDAEDAVKTLDNTKFKSHEVYLKSLL